MKQLAPSNLLHGVEFSANRLLYPPFLVLQHDAECYIARP